MKGPYSKVVYLLFTVCDAPNSVATSMISSTTIAVYGMGASTPTQQVNVDHTTQSKPSELADLISEVHNIPKFTDREAERKWAKEHLAGDPGLFAKFDYNDGAVGLSEAMPSLART